MQFWIDMRLATDGGESVKRRRLTGDMCPEEFDEFCEEMVACLRGSACGYRLEEDNTRVGLGPTEASE